MVQLTSASGLTAHDKNGLADPFVVAKLGKIKKTVASQVRLKTLAPRWDETLEFVTNRSQEGSQFVKGFGGIGGILRYKVDFMEHDYDYDEDEVDAY